MKLWMFSLFILIALWSVIVCECMHGVCACLCTCLSVCAGTHAMASVPRPKDNFRYCSSPFTCVRQSLFVFHLSVPHELAGDQGTLLALPPSCCMSTGNTDMCFRTWLCVGSGSFCLCSKHCTTEPSHNKLINRANGLMEFHLFTKRVGCGSARF